MNIGVLIAVSVLLASACWTDIRTMQIPNKLVLFFACGGLLYQVIFHGGMSGLLFAATGAVAGIAPLYLLFLLGGIGGGDVKWFGAFGIWTGALLTLQLMMYAIVVGGGIAVVVLLFRLPLLRKFAERVRWPWGSHPNSVGRGAHFPFMIAVAPGFLLLLGKG